MKVKIYSDRRSEPSRAVLIFCKVNEIDFVEECIDLTKLHNRTPHFQEINPMRKVPAMDVDGSFKLFESHAILIYLASAYPGVAEHWYPKDVLKRAKIHSVLDWHHTFLRSGAAPYIVNTLLAPFLGRSKNHQAATEAEKLLLFSLSKLESFWLKGNGSFLFGSNQPCVADLSLVCQIMQLHVLDDKDRDRFLGPHKKVQQWIENTRNATQPHFDELHKTLFAFRQKLFVKQLSRISTNHHDDDDDDDDGSDGRQATVRSKM